MVGMPEMAAIDALLMNTKYLAHGISLCFVYIVSTCISNDSFAHQYLFRQIRTDNRRGFYNGRGAR
jgi:hypothetical protein